MQLKLDNTWVLVKLLASNLYLQMAERMNHELHFFHKVRLRRYSWDISVNCYTDNARNPSISTLSTDIYNGKFSSRNVGRF